jgi:basic amino acid/polyamine antiporter, APA family
MTVVPFVLHPMAAASNPGLVRSLRRWDLVAVVLNGVVGAGIFGLPSRVFALTADYSLVCFAACALCVSLIVLSFAEVASRFSGTGGPYLFAREAYGPLTGFVVGWLVRIARVTSLAANCSLLPAYLGFFFPAAASGLPRAIILAAVVTALATVNVRGVRGAADASNVLAVGKMLPLGVFVVAGLFFMQPGRFSFAVAPTYHAFAQSVLLLVYAFTGFEMAVIPSGEARSPGQNLPPALLTGMAVVVTFYILIQVVCIGTLPGLGGSQRPLADAAATFLGTWGAAMITGGIVISLAGNLNVLILAASRVLFAMADRDQFASKAGIHSSPLPHARGGGAHHYVSHARPHSVRHVHPSAHTEHDCPSGDLLCHLRRPGSSAPSREIGGSDFPRARRHLRRIRRDASVRLAAFQQQSARGARHNAGGLGRLGDLLVTSEDSHRISSAALAGVR